jgi:hypothetical protein
MIVYLPFSYREAQSFMNSVVVILASQGRPNVNLVIARKQMDGREFDIDNVVPRFVTE